MKLIGTVVCVLLVSLGYSQTIQVVELSSDLPIPFVKVYPENGQPFLADIDGIIDAKSVGSQFTLKMNGYADSTFQFEGQKIVKLRSLENTLDEVFILPGINPAERIMELAIQNRKKNHPKSDESFKYTSYSKFVFTLNPDALAAIADTTTDSTLNEIKSYFDKQHLFLLESTTDHFFAPPFREKEIITAYKVAGFKDPLFSSFANELQTFNFYENQFNVFGASYINPLAFGGIRRYLFILKDSTINAAGDTTFTIQFKPRIGTNFDGLKGVLYINSRGYAVEKVIAEPAIESDELQAKIIQEYAFIENRKWFPVKLSTEANFPAMKIADGLENGYLIGKGTTYLENVQLNIDLSQEHFNAAMVQTANDAADKDSIHWNASRTFELNEKEEKTYLTVDSISKANKLEQKLSWVTGMMEGKLPLGKFQMDLGRLLDYRDYEGYRIGCGLENSDKLMKHITIGGYLGYGTRDHEWKYGGYSKLLLFPKQFGVLNFRFQDDLIERGGTTFLAKEKSFDLANYAGHLYVKNMDRQRIAESSFSIYMTSRMKIVVGMNYQRIRFTEDYLFYPISSQAHKWLEVAESFLEYQWHIGEKVLFLGAKRISLGSKWPVIRAKIAHALPNMGNSSMNYWRYYVDVQQIVPIRGVGKLQLDITGNLTNGDVPMVWQNAVNATGGNWNISVANSFETMLPSSFYSNKQLAFFTRFLFQPFRSKVKWSAPQLGVHHACGWGSFHDKSEHSVSFQSMDKGYFEGGVLVQNVLVSGKTGLGLGVFCPYGYYAGNDWDKNLTVKLALTVVL